MTHLLLENLRFLRRVEVHLRRRQCSGLSVIPAGEEAQLALARWSGYSTWAAFWADYCRTLTTNRRIVGQVVAERFAVEQSPAPVGGS
jgi:glutamine synthetase adenylyltransferase